MDDFAVCQCEQVPRGEPSAGCLVHTYDQVGPGKLIIDRGALRASSATPRVSVRS